MLELSAAPTPSPAMAATNSASAPDAQRADTSKASSSQDGQTAATPFAAALQHQIKKPAADAAAKHHARHAAAIATDRPSDATIKGPTDIPSDALSMLAPMLAGITAPAPVAEKTIAADAADLADADADDKELDPGLIIALPGANLPVTNANTKLPLAKGDDKPVTDAALLATKAQTPQLPSAILAATTSAAAESAAASGKTGTPGESFDALLNSARESQMMAGNNAAAAPAVATPASTTVAAPVGTRAWDTEIGDKLTWMVGRQESHAELVLNPPHLGRIEVSLTMNGDQASATFVSANPAVRDALENAVPRLREVLQDAGISLGQTQVGAESFQQSANHRENSDNPARNGARGTNSGSSMATGFVAGSSTPSQWLRRGNGLVDTFA